jgi:hypothetical protein
VAKGGYGARGEEANAKTSRKDAAVAGWATKTSRAGLQALEVVHKAVIVRVGGGEGERARGQQREVQNETEQDQEQDGHEVWKTKIEGGR